MQAKLVDLSLLSVEEVGWLNNYHSQVWDKVHTCLYINCILNFLWTIRSRKAHTPLQIRVCLVNTCAVWTLKDLHPHSKIMEMFILYIGLLLTSQNVSDKPWVMNCHSLGFKRRVRSYHETLKRRYASVVVKLWWLSILKICLYIMRCYQLYPYKSSCASI